MIHLRSLVIGYITGGHWELNHVLCFCTVSYCPPWSCISIVNVKKKLWLPQSIPRCLLHRSDLSCVYKNVGLYIVNTLRSQSTELNPHVVQSSNFSNEIEQPSIINTGLSSRRTFWAWSLSQRVPNRGRPEWVAMWHWTFGVNCTVTGLVNYSIT